MWQKTCLASHNTHPTNLVTFHFQELALNSTPKDQLRWPIFVFVVVYDSFDRKNVKIFTTYYILHISFFMSQDDAHYQNHRNVPAGLDGRGLSWPSWPSCCHYRMLQPSGELEGLTSWKAVRAFVFFLFCLCLFLFCLFLFCLSSASRVKGE